MRLSIALFLVVVSSCSPPPCSTCVDGGAGGVAIGGGLTNGGSAGGQSGGGALGGGSSGGAVAGGAAGGTTAGGTMAGGTTAGGSAAGGADAGADAGVPCPSGSLRIVQRGPLDLPPAAPGCVSRKRVALINTCDRPQVASISVMPSGAGFSSVQPSVLLPAGGAADVMVEFAPTTLGVRQAQLVASAGSNTSALGLRGLASTVAATDSFALPALPTADVLLVVSEGPGMAAPQQALANDFATFIRFAVASAVDFRIGVVRGAGGGLVRQGNEPLVLTPTVPNLANVFSSRVQVGAGGTPTSSCLKRATEALAIDSSWLRPNGHVGVLCMQNTFEDAPGSIGGWVDVARSFNDGGAVTINAHANFLPCAGNEDLQLRAAASETFGATSSICGPLSEAASKALFGFSASSTYPLSRNADPDGGFTLEIDGMAVPPTAPNGQGVWRYDATSNAIVFEPLYVPEPGKRVSIQYGARCR